MTQPPQPAWRLYEAQVAAEHMRRHGGTAWTWETVPERVLDEAGILTNYRLLRTNRRAALAEGAACNPLRDVGADFLWQGADGAFTAGQAKLYTPPKRVGVDDLGMFTHLLMAYPHLTGALYASTKLTHNLALMISQPAYAARLSFAELKAEVKATAKGAVSAGVRAVLRPDQAEAVTTLLEHFGSGTAKRGVLQAPCAWGKTLVFSDVAMALPWAVFCLPLRENVADVLDRATQRATDSPVAILVDADGSRDAEEVCKRVVEARAQGKRVYLGVTYRSADVLVDVVDVLLQVPGGLVVCDEFHNLPRAAVVSALEALLDADPKDVDEDDDEAQAEEAEEAEEQAEQINRPAEHPIFALLHRTDLPILFVSATPRIYELEGTDADGPLAEAVFGPTLVRISYAEARSAVCVTDYAVFVPEVDATEAEAVIATARSEAGPASRVGTLPPDLLQQAHFVLHGMTREGCRKGIVYARDCAHATALVEALPALARDVFGLDTFVARYTEAEGPSARRAAMTQFQTCAGQALLVSVRILDECVDVPCCDSTFHLSVTRSRVRATQRLMRAVRLDKARPGKVGKAFLWCTDGDDTAEFLSALKELDPDGTVDRVHVLPSRDVGAGEEGRTVAVGRLAAAEQRLRGRVAGVREYKFLEHHVEVMDAIDAFRAAHACVWPAPAGKRTITVAGTMWQEKVLGSWINSRRMGHKAGLLPAPLREAILARWRDWVWEVDRMGHCTDTMDAIDAFRAAHGGVWPATSGGKRTITMAGTVWQEKVLGTWISKRREAHKAARLRAPLREAILARWRDWVWEVDLMGKHTATMNAIDAFRAAHDGVWPSTAGKRAITVVGAVWQEKVLGSWISNRKMHHKAGLLQAPLREAILTRWRDWVWEVDLMANHTAAMEAIDAFRVAHGDVWPSQGGKRTVSVAGTVWLEKVLGTWISTRRMDHKEGRLPALLREAILARWRVWMWEVTPTGHYTDTMDAIDAFRAAHGGVWPAQAGKRTVPVAGTVWHEKVLGSWISNRRAGHKAGLLPAPLREAILARWRDWVWEVDRMGHCTDTMDAIDAFRAAHGGAWPSAHGKRAVTVAGTVWQEKVLRTWIGTRRADHKAGRLPEPLLEAILARWRDWVWEVDIMGNHTATMDAIDAFRAAHGGVWPANVQGNRTIAVAGTVWLEKVLGSWISGRKVDHKAGRLQAPLREAILARWRDWVWDPMGNHTAAMDAIDAFRAAHGGAWPAQGGKRTVTVAGTVWHEKVLGSWISSRRTAHKAGRMPAPLREAILARWGDAWKWSARE